jgi:hypothetical protein
MGIDGVGNKKQGTPKNQLIWKPKAFETRSKRRKRREEERPRIGKIDDQLQLSKMFLAPQRFLPTTTHFAADERRYSLIFG